MKKRGLFAILFGMAVLSFGLFNSCDIDIGLGSAVDTEPPKVTIENPPIASIIRDAFPISGTWTDDGTLSDINVVLKSTDNSESEQSLTYSFKGTVGKDNTWSCLIDPKKEGATIRDGEYEATVTVYDNGGHHTVITRSFTIDNTPPVVVFEKPSSSIEESDINKIQTYGQYFTIAGEAEDDSKIQKIVIKFYSKEDPDTLICEKELTDVATKVSLDVAKFGDELYTKLYGYNNVEKILEEIDPEDFGKTFKCEIIAYDRAKRYPEIGKELEGDDLGNYETKYILSSDFQKFQSDYSSVTGNTSRIQLKDLYSIRAGKLSIDSSRKAAADTLISNLFDVKAISAGSFTLNPLNNPTFSISGFDIGVENNVENDGALTIQFSKGLDGYDLEPETLKVYLIETKDSNGNAIPESERKIIYPQNSTYKNIGDGQFLTIIQKDNCKDSEGESVSLEYGAVYIVRAYGFDTNGNEVVPSFDGKEFFIRFKAKNVAPNLNITEPSLSNTYLKKGESLWIKGTTSVPDGYPTVTITCKKGEETEGTLIYKETVTREDIDKVEGGYIYYNFEFEVPTEPETEDDFWFDQSNPDQYVFDITSTLESMPTSRTKTVIYDVKAPTITPISILPEAEKYTGEEDRSKAAGSYLNGIVTMKVSIIDDYTTVQSTLEEGKDRRPYFIIVDEDDKEIEFCVGSETKATKKHYITTPANQTFDIHTEDIATGTESKTVIVKIYAEDTAGNKAYAEKQYIVDQTTDIPVIFPYNHNNLTLTYATLADVNEALRNKVRKSIITKGSDLQLRINDDDGIAKYTFKISDKNTGDNLVAPDGYNNQELSDTPTTYDFRYTVPNISGKYKCSFEVTDTVGKTNAKEFWIVVTEAAPQLSIDSTSPDNKIITLSNGLKEDSAKVSFTNTVSIDSGYENFIVKRVENVNGTDEETILYGQTEEDKLNGHSFTDTFTPSANRSENKIKYVVIDEMNNPGEREFVYNVDSTKPVIEENSITVPSNKQTESVSFRFEATAKDVAGSGELKPSGVSKIQYTFDSAKAAGSIKTIPGVTSLSETIYFNNEDYSYAFGTEGQKTIYIRAIDDVGNIGDWVSKNFMFDTKAPSVNIASYKRASESAVAFAENTASKSFESGEAFTLSGTVSDNNGIEAFEIWQIKDPADGDDSLGIKLTDIDVSSIDSDGKWTVTGLPRDEENITQPQSVIASGNYKYTVRAIDTSAFGTGSNAQSAKKTDETVNVKIDRTAPIVTISLATGNTSDSTAYGENSIKGSAYTFRGTAEDTGDSSSGFDTLYYAFTTTEVEPSAYTLFVKPTTSSWSIPMNLVTATKTNSGTASDDTLTEGKHFLYIKGKDKAGNYSETKHVAFMVDQNAPEVSCQVYKNNTNETAETPVDGTVYLNAQSAAQSYTLRGTAWDANGISRVTVDGVAVTVGSDGKWSKEITVQGKNNHEIVVYDNSGNTSISAKQSGITCSVIFDTALPTATIEGFDTSATQIEKWLSGTGDYYINGTASDGNGSGLKDIKIKVSDAAWATLPLTSNWSYKYTIPSNLEENSFEATSYHTVIIKVVDNANNEKSITYYFRYDKTQPEANLYISKSGYLNAADLADIVISGYAHDGREEGRALEYAKIIVNNDEDSAIDVTTAAFAYNTTAGENYGNFSKVGLASADYPDGRYEFKLDVKDKAHNTPSASSALTASFVVDKTAPSITKRAFILNGTEIPSSLSSNKSKAKIHVEFDEVNPEAVYYYVDDRSDATLTQENVPVADWINMNFNGSNNSWTAEKDCSFNDGNGLVYIKVEDKAGNVSYASPLSYEVDTKAPDVCTLGTVSVKNDDNTLTALSGTKLVNGTKPVVFTVTATDHNDNHDATVESDPAKVASVSVKAGGGVKAVTADFTYTHTAAGVWTITIPANQLDNGAVSVTVTDTFGNSKNYNSLFTLELDDKYPSLGNYSLASSYDATSTGAATKTFYMNNQKNGFKLEGIAKDDRINDGDNNGEIEKVELTLTAGTNSQTLTSNSSAWTFEIANNEWKNWTGDVTGTITITDKAKNVQAYTDAFTIKFDNVAPKAKHWADNSNKDIYFRIGNAANDKNAAGTQWETGDAVNAANNSKNEDVGKKYSYGSWGNDSTIEIRGNFYEAASGSGLKTIYYAIFDSNPVTTNVTINGEELTLKAAFESGILKAKSQSSNVNAIGSFAPLETAETRKVPYTAADGSRTSQEVVSNFRTSLPGFNGVENYLLLVAEDYVGNRAVDDLENSNTDGNATWNSSKTYYHINKDATAPSISGSVTEGSYTNGSSGNIVVSGTASDNDGGSGLGSVKIRITDNNNETVEIENRTEKTATISGNTWEVAIPASTFNSGVYTVYAKATDRAGEGNSKEVNAGTITFDNTKPTIDAANIKFTETKGSSTTNVYKSGSTYYLNNTTAAGKTFKLSGLAQDNLAVDSVNITVKNNAGTVVESLSQEKPTNGTWEFTIGDWSSLTTGATIVINAKDKAGNTLAETEKVKFAVKFDIDAPDVVSAKLKVPGPSDTEKNLFKFEGENGSVTDSGTTGTLSGFNKVEFAFTKTNEAPNASTYIETATVDSNGAWSSNVEFKKQALQSVFGTPTESDEGTKYLWVRAYDNAGNVSGWVSKDFKYDTATPTISLTDTTPAEGSYTNTSFTVEAEAADTYGIQKIEIFKVENSAETLLCEVNGSNGIYSKAFVVGPANAESENYLADGNYNLKVKVTDLAGKQNSVTRTVKVDTTAPTGTWSASTPEGTVVGSGTDARTWYKTSSIKFAFALSDTELNIDTVKISKNSTDWESMSPSNGVYVATLTDFDEGSKTITVEMKDLAGNTNTATKTIYVDTTAPTINADTSTVLSFMPLAGFTVSGSVNDTSTASVVSGVKSLKVKEERKAPNAPGYSETSASSNGGVEVIVTDGSWSRPVPLGTLEDGEYQYTLILTDEAGNQTTKKLPTTKVDKTAPTLDIINPTEKTGTSAISSTSYQFSGTITEDNSVSAIYYKVLSDTAEAPSAPTTNVMNATSWTGADWISVSPDRNWSFYREDIGSASGDFAEGKHKIYMYVLDGAGNLSDSDSTAAGNQPYAREFDVDTAVPAIITKIDSDTITTNTKQVKTSNYTFKFKPYDSCALATTNPYTISVKKNSTSLTEGANGYSISGPDSEGFYTVAITGTVAGDGTYEYSVTAKDWAEKTTTETRIVQLDTTAPVLAVITPDLSNTTYQDSTNLTIKGSSTDESGTGAVYYKYSTESPAPAVPTENTTAAASWTSTGWTAASGTTSWTINNLKGIEGSVKYLYLAAVDTNGLVSNVTTGYVKVDTANPTSTTTTSTLITNETVTLTGTAWDKNAIKKITISDGTEAHTYSTDDETPTISLSGTPGTLADAVSDLTKVTWTKTFELGSASEALADGNYTFTITVEDNAGKTTIKTREVTIDTAAPVIDMSNTSITRTADHTDTNSVGWHKSEQIPVTVSVSDDGSGISAVQIATDTGFTNPTNLRQSASGWTGTIVCSAQGANTIYIKATDAVGNASTVGTTNSLTVMIDTSAPAEPIFLGAGLSDTSMIPASEITSVLVNKQTALTVYGALVDSESSDKSTGIPTASTAAAFKQKGKSGTSANVAFTALPTAIKNSIPAWQATHAYEAGDVVNYSSKAYICTTAHTSAATFASTNWKEASLWKYTIPTTGMTNGGLNFTVSDNIGNTADYTLFQMVVDNSAPSLTVGQLPDADITTTVNEINGVISISGTASDENGLSTTEQMKLYYTTSSTLTANPTSGSTGNIGTNAASNWVEIGSIAHANSWSFNNINTASLERTYNSTNANETYTTTVYFKVVVKDKAGNTQYSERITATVDQDTDRPVIKFTNLKLNTGILATPYMSATNTLPFNTNALYGSVTDDDGVSSLAYQYAESDTALSDTGWTDLNLTNGTFTLNFPQDGTKKLYFKVVDTGKTVQTVESTPTIVDGSTFTSASANTYSLNTPKLTDSEITPNKYGYRGEAAATIPTVTYLTVDTTAPWAGTLQFSTNYTDATASTATWTSKSEINNMPFGGRKERQTFRIRIPAWDVNGIKSVLMTLTGSDEADTTNETIEFTNSTLNAGNTTYTAATWWISEEIDVSGSMVSGNKTCLITVTDKANKTSTDEFIISVDNTAPVITASNPSSTQYSSGNVIAYGETDLLHWKNTSTTDTPTEHMYYALSLDDETEPAEDYEHRSSATAITTWKDEDGTAGQCIKTDENGYVRDETTDEPVLETAVISYKPYYTPILGGSFNWYVYFDGNASTAGETHDATFRNFLVNSGVTTQDLLDTIDQDLKFRTKVKAYLWIKAVDQVGNYTVIKHPILIDPQGDAPNVTIDYPEASGTSLGGAIILRGSANDTKGTNPGVESVWVQIISSIENGYNSSADASHLTGTRTAGGLEFEDTVTSTGSGSNKTYSHDYTLNSFAPKLKDVKQWISNGYQVYQDITTIDDASTTAVEGPTAVTSVTGDDTADGSAYYIKANFSGSAWNLKINDHAEFNPGTGELNPIAYRVFAKDKDGNLSSYEQQLSVYDSDNPIISNVYLRQYSNNAEGTGTVTASRAYEDDMWVRGTWWLCGTVKDTEGLSKLEVGPATAKVDQAPTKVKGVDEVFKYKLGTDSGVGQLTIVIEAADIVNAGQNPHRTTKECVINFDNTPPELLGSTSANFKISSAVQNSNGFYTFGSQVMENPVGNDAQSGFDYLAFWFEREITGTNGKHVVYDVMRPKTQTNGDTVVNTSEVAWADLATFTNVEDARGLKWKSKTVTRSQSELGQLTLTGTDANIHVGGLCMIRGSIYMINSVVTTGTGSSATTTIGIDGQPEYNTASETAYFAIANVVNNTVEAGSGTKSTTDGMYGYYSSMSNDDGDHMIESVSKQGTVWTWEANINSQNMKDGSIVLHYVAFDKAGNFITDQVDGNIANNAPRLASLRVWSDFNENGTEDAGESDTKWVNGKERKINDSYGTRSTAVTNELIVSNNNKDYDNGGSAFMTVKATTRFIPELVGGNGDLYYTYKYGTAGALDSATVKIGSTSIGKGADDGIDEEIDDSGYYVEDQNQAGYINGRTDLYDEDTEDSAKHYMEIPGAGASGSYSLNGIGNSTDATGPTWFEYTIYDSTEGSSSTWNATTHDTTGRLSAKFRVALNLKYQDTTRPVVKIRPFYWNSLTDNSVDKPASPSSVADLRGHIELEGDLTDKIKGNGEGQLDMGDDPKVSGKIIVEGYAYDDIKLKELYVQMSNHTNLKGSGTNGVKVASYDGSWITTTHDADAGWDFTASDVYCNGNGHLVYWKLTVDTAKRTTVAATNQSVVVYAVDARGSDETKTSIHNGTTQTTLPTYVWGDVKEQTNALKTYYTDFYCNTSVTASTPASTIVYKASDLETSMTYYYQMDIVPYITKVTTGLSSLKNAKQDSIYSRTSLGHYPVSVKNTGDEGADELTNTITISGFNLGTTTTVSLASISTEAATKGYYDHKVSNIPALNNYNKNDASGTSYVTLSNADVDYEKINKYGYNRIPNNSNNNKLTDDVIFDVWKINSDAARTYEGNTALREPVVRVNPTNGVVGMAFGNGSSRFSMPNKAGDNTGTSYELWQYNYATYVNIALCYDENGVAHGISTGIDTYVTDSSQKAGRMSYFKSAWGPSRLNNVNGNFEGENAIRFDCIGIPRRTETAFGVTTGTDPLLEEYRFYSPSIVATGKNRTNPTVYYAYYDKLSQQIRFRAGDIGDTVGTNGQFVHASPNGEPAFIDNHYSVISGTSKYSNKNNMYHGGKYLGIDVIPGTSHDDDVVVAVWQDAITDALIFAYNDAPYDKVNKQWNEDTGDSGWKGYTPVKANAGFYCKVKCDSTGNVHIASVNDQDEVCYTYIPYTASSKTFGTPVTVTIDTFESGVKKVAIDVDKNNLPYITYFGTKGQPKIAYLPSMPATKSETTLKGCDTNGFTGVWEVGFIPTNSKLADDDARNQTSVWAPKNLTGTAAATNFYGTGGKEKATGITLSNTTSPLVGYGVSPDGTSGRIELAQKR